MTTHPFQYRGGWAGTQTWSDADDRWIRVVAKDGRRVEQGARTFEQLLDALDRLDGRPVMRDFINGLQAGMTAAEASVPLRFGPEGDPLSVSEAPAPTAAPTVAPICQALALVGFQQSLFGEDAFA